MDMVGRHGLILLILVMHTASASVRLASTHPSATIAGTAFPSAQAKKSYISLIRKNQLFFPYFEKVCYNDCIFPGSSMVEQEAVNFEVTGSSPVRGARFCTIMGYLA